jgi:hypothetical protein
MITRTEQYVDSAVTPAETYIDSAATPQKSSLSTGFTGFSSGQKRKLFSQIGVGPRSQRRRLQVYGDISKRGPDSEKRRKIFENVYEIMAKVSTPKIVETFIKSSLSEEARKKLEAAYIDMGRQTLTKHTLLGNGGFGSVFSGTLEDQSVAIKCLDVKAGDLAPAFREVLSLIKLRDTPGVIQIIGFTVQPKSPTNSYPQVLIVTPRYRCTLETIIGHGGSLTFPTVLNLILQTAETVERMHKKRLVHMDIKPSNILLGTEPDGSLSAVVGDMGGLDESFRVTNKFYSTKGYSGKREAVINPNYDYFSVGAIILLVVYRQFVGGREGATDFESKMEYLMSLREFLPQHTLALLKVANIFTELYSDKSESLSLLRRLVAEVYNPQESARLFRNLRLCPTL